MDIVLVVTGAKVLIEEGPVPINEYCIMSMLKIYLRNVNCCVFLQILPAVICVLFSVRMAEVVDLKFEAKLSFHNNFAEKYAPFTFVKNSLKHSYLNF